MNSSLKSQPVYVTMATVLLRGLSDESPCLCYCCITLSCVQLFAPPWTVACQTPLSMGFSRQVYWSGLSFSSPGDLPHPCLLDWQADEDIHFFIFLLNLFIFNGRITALQYWIGFCHTSMWISHTYTYVFSFLNLLPISLPTPPL